ncbi:hypothetical protein B1812_18730 [Methylocystis bryophila]|uniref:Peptidase S54 rhomboid domain-containing protein n=1 Tax=Methylocystis bryophila TaxID=655015 RepID=A0A1W6N1P7_9HYPH|nr:hypothetical protein B1812_18730 [Methylocystis bryophila]
MVKREPIFNIPSVIVAIVAVIVAVQLAAELLPQPFGLWLFGEFAFIPARVSFLLAPAATLRDLADLDADELTGLFDRGPLVTSTMASYAFLHANWTHVGVNAVSLLAFGSPVAKRLGSRRFFLFFIATAVGGALAHLATHPFSLEAVVGASAGISGAIGAIARFAFAPGGALHEDWGRAGAGGDTQPLQGLLDNRRAAIFVATWLLANVLFGTLSTAPGGAGPIAWEAHLGGFLAGLMLYGWFEPRRRPASPSR